MRASLALLAIVELIFAVSGVIADPDASAIHDTRHLGAFGAAIAGALLFVAWKPRHATGLRPVVIALGLAIPTFALVDFVHQNLSTAGGVHHIVQMVGLGIVWLLSTLPIRRDSAPSVDTKFDIGHVARPPRVQAEQ